MKKDIHPKYHKKAKISCACGNSFTVGSTLPEIKVELCSACHPFYTGKQKLVDTARRVEKYQAKVKAKKEIAKVRKGKKAKRTARDMVRDMVKAKKEVTIKVGKSAPAKTAADRHTFTKVMINRLAPAKTTVNRPKKQVKQKTKKKTSKK